MLKIGFNKITHIDNKLGNLKQLKTLELPSNYLPEIPSCIFKLQQLENLDLSNTCKPAQNPILMPASILALKNLRSFKLGSNRYTFSNFPKFESIEGNPIDLSNPMKIAEMAFLKGDNNCIPYIFEYGTSSLIQSVLNKKYDPDTQEMSLNGLTLTKLPEELTNFKIKILNLRGTGQKYTIAMDSLNNILTKLVGLEELMLNDNELLEAPNLSGLNKLTYLDLSDNCIEQLSIAHLPALESLHINRNRLKAFPVDIYKQSNLQYLFIDYAFKGTDNIPTLKDLKPINSLKNLKCLEQSVFDYNTKELKILESYYPESYEFD